MKARWPRFPSKATWPEFYRRNSCVFNGWVLHVTKKDDGYHTLIWKDGGGGESLSGSSWPRATMRSLGVFPTNAEAKKALEQAATEA